MMVIHDSLQSDASTIARSRQSNVRNVLFWGYRSLVRLDAEPCVGEERKGRHYSIDPTDSFRHNWTLKILENAVLLMS